MSEQAPVLYVHVADDGGLFAIDGATGQADWISEDDLVRRLGLLRGAGGSVLMSRERGSRLAAAATQAIEATGVPVLSASEAHPDTVRQGGATTLMVAAYTGASDLVQDLLRRGADVGARDEDGFTALMYAANGGQLETVRSLVGAGADVNQTDGQGSTALMFAAQHGHLAIVKRLLAAGAEPGRRRVDGLTARELAVRNGHDRVAAVVASVERQRP